MLLYLYRELRALDLRNKGLLISLAICSVLFACSNDGKSTPDTVPTLGFPSGITAEANSANSITVSWEAVSGATEYIIYRSVSASGTYTELNSSTAASYTDGGLSAGTEYFYKVATNNSGGTGNQSNYVSATTLPSAPTGLTSIANSTTSITVSWEAVFGATGYYIYFSENASGNYIEIGNSTDTSYVSNGHQINTTYYYKVAAFNSSGIGLQSIYISATTLPSDPEAPNPPSEVIAEAISTSGINIGWAAVQGATGYYIYRSGSASGIYTEIGTSTVASYADSELLAGTTYYYRVAAYNNGGTGSQSSNTSAITFPDEPVGITKETVSTTSVKVNWEAVLGAAGYYIYRSESADGTYVLIDSSATTSYTDSELSAGKTYYYKIAAYNNGGKGAQSEYISTATLPSEPTEVTAETKSDSIITVSWKAVSGATGYRIYRSTKIDGDYTSVGTSTTTSHENSGLTSNTTYYYKVAAYNSGGTGAQSSSAVSATTMLNTPSVTAEAVSTTSVKVTWEEVLGATGYIIYRSGSASGTYTELDSSETPSYTDSGLSEGATYYYKVSAYNDIVSSIQSGAVVVTMLPSIPTGVNAIVNSNGTSVTVKWETVPEAMGYNIYRSESKDDVYEKIHTSTSTQYIDDNILSSKEYYYKVAAYNNAGEGSESIYAYAIYYGSVKDDSGKVYKTVKIGTQTWMAENLNYYVSYTRCYGNLDSNCDKYGRLYNWSNAMDCINNCDEDDGAQWNKGICPIGWHIPTKAEWEILLDYVGGYSTASIYLKSTSGWNNSGNGTDSYGFAALPGSYYSDGSTNLPTAGIGDNGIWNTSDEYSSSNNSSYYIRMTSSTNSSLISTTSQSVYSSVRCLKDD